MDKQQEEKEKEEIQKVLKKLKEQWKKVAESNFRLIEREKIIKNSEKETNNQKNEKI